MRPRSSVEAITIFTRKDADGNWIPLKIEVNSWVTLMPGSVGGHAKDAKKHGGSGMDGSYKAKILKFKIGVHGSLSMVKVQHAYMWRQLDLDPQLPYELSAACNYLYPSSYMQWLDPKCIEGVICVTHAEVGELMRGSRLHKELLQDGVFFYNASYATRTTRTQFGTVQSIPLPSFNSPDWPLPDMCTTEAFRARLHADFQNAMRPTTGSSQTHLSWFMPICVFIDLFAVADTVHRTNTMWIFKQVSDALCESLMDGGWDSKVTFAADAIKCVVAKPSLIFRFHIARSTWYARFVYNRQRRVSLSEWVDLDQYMPTVMVTVHYEMDNRLHELDVGLNWSLVDIRQEVAIQFGIEANIVYQMWIANGATVIKINARNEKRYTTAVIMPPKVLRLLPKL